MMFRPVRIRLTLWYVGVFAVILAVFGTFVYLLMARSIRQRVDAGLRNVVDVAALSLQHEIEEHEGKAEGEDSFRRVLATMHQRIFPRQGIAVYEGSRLVARKPGEGGVVPEPHDPREEPFHTNDNRRDAIGSVYVEPARSTYQIVVAEPLGAANEELWHVGRILLTALPAALLLTAVLGWFLAQRSLRPIVAMSDQQRQFMADASHELRTPISVARTAAEVTLDAGAPGPEHYRESLGIIRQQMLRLSRIVTDMFTLAQADAGVYSLQPAPFYLDELVRECSAAASVLGSRRGVRVEVVSAPESLCHGDEGLIRQLVMILLDNAVKYTAEGGVVRVSLERGEREYRLSVADTGCGIPAQDQPLIFRRFYRVDKARSRAFADGGGSGSGLGLAIGKWIAEVHHGTLELTRSGPEGSLFTARLPVG